MERVTLFRRTRPRYTLSAHISKSLFAGSGRFSQITSHIQVANLKQCTIGKNHIARDRRIDPSFLKPTPQTHHSCPCHTHTHTVSQTDRHTHTQCHRHTDRHTDTHTFVLLLGTVHLLPALALNAHTTVSHTHTHTQTFILLLGTVHLLPALALNIRDDCSELLSYIQRQSVPGNSTSEEGSTEWKQCHTQTDRHTHTQTTPV